MRLHSPLAPGAITWKFRQLIVPLARRKIASRYRGSVLGMLWALLNPLIMLGIYTFIFSVVFQSKWGGAGDNQFEFALFLFSGLILYLVFSECVNEAPSLLVTNKLYIQQLVFPTEVLPWVSLYAALFNLAINWLILMIFYSVVVGLPSPTVLYMPLIALPIVFITVGAVWFISSIGLYLRDIAHVVGLLTTALLFLSPIFYPASAVPDAFQAYYSMNPFVPILEMSKGALFHGLPPDWPILGCELLGSWIFAWLGYTWFMHTKKGFPDVV